MLGSVGSYLDVIYHKRNRRFLSLGTDMVRGDVGLFSTAARFLGEMLMFVYGCS